MRERLIELIMQAEKDFMETHRPILDIEKYVADYLLANNVTVPLTEIVWFIVDKNTKYAMVMPRQSDELPLYMFRDLEKYGYYQTKEEAEEALKKRGGEG